MIFKQEKTGSASSVLGGRENMRLKASWISLFNFTTKKHLPTLSSGTIFALGAGLAMPIFAIILGDIFDTLTSFTSGYKSADQLRSKVAHHSTQFVVVGAANWFLSSSYYTCFTAFGELQAGNARSRLFGELLKRDVEWFQKQQDGIGAFLSGLQAQVHELQVATSQPLAFAVQYSFRGLLSIILAFYTSWSLTLVTLAGIPVFSALITFLSSKMKPSIEAQQAELSSASKTANNAISAIDTVKCLNGQEFESRNFTSRIESAAAYYLKQARVNSAQLALVRFMIFCMVVQSFWYGHSLKHSGKLSSGDVLRTFWACVIATQSLEQVLPRLILLEKGKIAGSALKWVVENRAADASRVISGNEMRGELYPPFCEGDVEVSEPGTGVLKSANLVFPAGETTFIIGKSGSGKSTLGQLLMRFYSPSSGKIRIDGVPIQKLDINWVRNNITLVEQRSVLFNESMRMNIAFGRRNYEQVREKDMQGCIDLAMLQNVIDNLPHGIETSVGPGGSFLSGGQRQRVAIARARLRDTPILIMDEPTSALDFANRTAVFKAIREWRKGKTTIIITHDLSHIHDNDFVYVMEQGSVVTSGYRNEIEGMPELGKFFSPEEKESNSSSENRPRHDSHQAVPINGLSYPSDDASMSSASSSLDLFLKDDYKMFEDAYTQGVRKTTYSGSGVSNCRESLVAQPGRRSKNVQLDPTIELASTSIVEPDRVHTAGPSPRTNPFLRHSTASMYSLPMLNLPGVRSQSPNSKQQARERRKRRKMARSQKKEGMSSLRDIMLTIIPNLTVGQRVFLGAGLFCATLHGSATPVFAYCMSQLFVSFFSPKNDTHEAMKWSLSIIGIAVVDSLMDGGMHYCLEYSGHSWVDTLRKKAIRRVLDQPRVWFEKEKNQPLKITACLDRNGEDMRNIVGKFTGFLLVAVVIATIAIIWSLISCWKLTLVTLSCCPVVYAITKGFQITAGIWDKRCNEASDVASSIFAETFSEICTVRTLTLEFYFHQKYLGAASRCVTTGIKKAAYTGVLFGVIESIIMFVSALVFYYGVVLVTTEESTIDHVMTVESMLLFSIGYVSNVLSWIPQISTSRNTAAQLLRLSNLPEGVSHEHRGKLSVNRIVPVKFSEANFRYPSRPDALVLRNASITIPANSCTAIVGRSGSGKSTIASLLVSLYEVPESGEGYPSISVGGVDIRDLHTPSLRSKISIVSQQPILFPDTIRGNISYGLEEKSPLNTIHNIRAAAQAAGIDEFISSLPNGYLTMVGDGGVGLSGGQAQRVVIARALVREPQMLILDEATSALDAESAEVIRRTVKKLVASRRDLTVIIITHAKEMMGIADKVVIMDDGSVVEQGAYQDVVGKGGNLRALTGEDEEVALE